MTEITKTYGKTIAAYWSKARKPIPLNPECPNCAILMRGRKGESRDGELTVAEEVAAGTKRRKPTGIYGKSA